MRARWWGRRTGLAIAAVVLTGSLATATAGSGQADAVRWYLVGRTTDGAVVLRVPLAEGRFSLEYRNSVYGSPAVEHFAVADDGRLALVGLAATDAAVLDEYYATADPPRRAAAGSWAGWWHAAPAVPLELASLTVAATRHGERTLVAGGAVRVELWRAVEGHEPGIRLEARPAG